MSQAQGKHCPDCGHLLTVYRDDGTDPLTPYNAGDLVGRCDNPQCVGEGSTWRIRCAKARALPCAGRGRPEPVASDDDLDKLYADMFRAYERDGM